MPSADAVSRSTQTSTHLAQSVGRQPKLARRPLLGVACRQHCEPGRHVQILLMVPRTIRRMLRLAATAGVVDRRQQSLLQHLRRIFRSGHSSSGAWREAAVGL